MPKSKFTKSQITSIVTAVPPIQKSIDDEIALFEGGIGQIQMIKKHIGIDKRHVVDEKTTTSDLCKYAVDYLLDGTKIKKEAIDALIFVSQTPDYIQPFTAAYLHNRLNLSEDCASFDVNLGCSGYVYGLWLAHMMVETNSCKNILLLAGDTLSKCVNPKDKTTAPLFGDAGSATLIQRAKKTIETTFILHTDGSGFEHLIIPAGGFRTPRSLETGIENKCEDGNIRSLNDLHMNGDEVFNFSVKVEPICIQEILTYTKKTIEEIDYIIFHQANKYTISNIARRLNLPLEKAPHNTMGKFGNQSSASIPATINDSISKELQNETKKIIMSGFGVGFSWATCLTDLNPVYCPEILYYS